MISGANAVRGDTVRNLTTGEVGTMDGYSQFGRIIVKLDTGARPKWEWWECEVLRAPSPVANICKSILLGSTPGIY